MVPFIVTYCTLQREKPEKVTSSTHTVSTRASQSVLSFHRLDVIQLHAHPGNIFAVASQSRVRQAVGPLVQHAILGVLTPRRQRRGRPRLVSDGAVRPPDTAERGDGLLFDGASASGADTHVVLHRRPEKDQRVAF